MLWGPVVPQDFGWIMQARAGGGQSGAGGADTISKDGVPQCCCFWVAVWGAAQGERGPAQLSCERADGVTCCNLGSGQSTKRVPACR